MRVGEKVTSYEILFNRIHFYLFNVFVFIQQGQYMLRLLRLNIMQCT